MGTRLFRIACLCLVLPLASCGEDRLVVSDGQLILEPRTLDFKEVAIGLSVALTVKVNNPGPRSVTLSAITVEGGAYSVSAKTLTIAPGDFMLALVSFSPTSLGEATGVASFKSVDGVVTLGLRGVGVPRMTCRPCSSPPTSFCASSQTLVTYAPSGTCIEGGCEFTANSEACSGECDNTARTCVTRDAGSTPPVLVDAGPARIDAGNGGGGVVIDAGVIDGGAFDAGPPRPSGYVEFFDAGEYTWIVPPGVTGAMFHGCGAGGAGGSVMGATGGGAACGEARFSVQPGRAVRVSVGRGGQQPGNGGGYTGLYFTASGSIEDSVLGGGGGGGNGCATCSGHFGGKGGAGGAEIGQDGEHYFGSGATCSVARGGLGGRELGGPFYGAGGLGGESPSGSGGVRCAGGFGSRLQGGSSKTVDGTTCNANGGAFGWREGGSELGGGGAGGAGAFGGGGGGFVKDLCGGGGGGGSSYLLGSSATIYAGDGRNPGFVSFGRSGAGRGGEEAIGPAASFRGADGYVLIEWY